MLYEAAEIDGANAWHRFKDIILPSISTIVVLNLIAIARCVPERPSYLRLFARPVLITAVMALAARSSYGLLSRSLPERWAVLPAIAVAVVVYGVLVLALGAVTRQDVLDLPKGEKIARMLHLH